MWIHEALRTARAAAHPKAIRRSDWYTGRGIVETPAGFIEVTVSDGVTQAEEDIYLTGDDIMATNWEVC